MDKKEKYNKRLEELKGESDSLIDEIKGSENHLKKMMNPVYKEVKRVYVKEANKLIDYIIQDRLDEIKREESKLGSMIVKQVMGAISYVSSLKADESEYAKRFARAALKGYEMDKIKKTMVKRAATLVKRKVLDDVTNMEGEEFMKSLENEKKLTKSLKSMFRKELDKLFNLS